MRHPRARGWAIPAFLPVGNGIDNLTLPYTIVSCRQENGKNRA
jgi:hypothetical protein